MGALTGNWYIYAQNIGGHALLRQETKISIDDRNKAEFELIEQEPPSPRKVVTVKETVTFKEARGQWHGRPHYSGQLGSRLYWAQIHESNGLKTLVGYIATDSGGTIEYGSVFLGLLKPKGQKRDFSELEIPFDVAPFQELEATPYHEGSLHISRPDGTVRLSLQGAVTDNVVTIVHEIRKEETIKGGIQLVAERYDRQDPSRPVLVDQLALWIIFDRASCPLHIGYHWRPTAAGSRFSGPPEDQRCTLVGTGSCGIIK
jgi:hypothetical protein